MSEQLSWFPFEPMKFVGDSKVIDMTEGEVGIYITLLCYAWTESGLPTSMSTLAKMARVPEKSMVKAWRRVGLCFRECDGRYVQPHMEEVREQQRARHERFSQSGKRGGRPRNNESLALAGLKPGLSHEKARPKQKNRIDKIREEEASPPSAREDSADDDPPETPTGDFDSPSLAFAKWFVQTGIAARAIDPMVGANLSHAALKWLDDATLIVETHGVDEARARAERLFAWKTTGELSKRYRNTVTLASLIEVWGYRRIAEDVTSASAGGRRRAWVEFDEDGNRVVVEKSA